MKPQQLSAIDRPRPRHDPMDDDGGWRSPLILQTTSNVRDDIVD
jgi:hypothetical protein